MVAELKPGGVNLVQANGAAAGQTVPHLHVHIMPRHAGDGASLNWEQKPGDMKEIRSDLQEAESGALEVLRGSVEAAGLERQMAADA